MTVEQYTSEEQMQSLSPKAFEYLTEWMMKRGHIDAQPWTPGDYDMSIGEMLEFLEEHPSTHFGNLANSAMIDNGVLYPVDKMIGNLWMATRGILEYE